jgi:hypothetical protein
MYTHYINGFNMQLDVLFINKNHKFNTIVNELLLYFFMHQEEYFSNNFFGIS